MALFDLERDEVVRSLVTTLSPEQVLAAFEPEQVVLALPDEALRALSGAYLDTLSAPTRAAIRARIGR